ncbi:hypothetical protein ARMSODRAFT_299699 [Armillaria solidipes]|uniref:Uncharacterized protein n=1 Tax=Armillaria solidipes TaxID=1076256 RepID=A0A2H3BA70_9AGAR|nr:hypothetical protein ARMSODRAFT_299699 [Armillaria solidipes]
MSVDHLGEFIVTMASGDFTQTCVREEPFVQRAGNRPGVNLDAHQKPKVTQIESHVPKIPSLHRARLSSITAASTLQTKPKHSFLYSLVASSRTERVCVKGLP